MDLLPVQQGRCPGEAQKEQGAGQGSRKAEGWLLRGDAPQPGPGPGAVFPGTQRLRAEPESIRARRLRLPSPARSVDSPRAAARRADQLSAAACLAAGGRRCWGFLAGAAQPAGLSPRSKRFTAAPANDFVSYSRVPSMQVGETEAQSVKCLGQAQPPLVGWWWIQPVDVLHGTMFGPVTAACSPRVLSSEPLKAARLPVITLSGPLTNLKAWPLTRGEDPRAVLWRTGRGQRVFSEETGRWQPPSALFPGLLRASTRAQVEAAD